MCYNTVDMLVFNLVQKKPKPNNSPCAAAQILTLLNHFKCDAMLSLYSSFMPPHWGRVVVCPWLALKFSLHNVNQEVGLKLQQRSDLALPGEDVGGGGG